MHVHCCPQIDQVYEKLKEKLPQFLKINESMTCHSSLSSKLVQILRLVVSNVNFYLKMVPSMLNWIIISQITDYRICNLTVLLE